MRLFVTGGTGFIGSHFLSAALAKGHEIVAIRRSESVRPGVSLPQIERLRWLDKDMSQVSPEDFIGCEAVVHLAAAGVDLGASWATCFDVNVIQSLGLWTTAIHAGLRRFLICGSCFEYGKSGERYDFIPTTAPLEPTGPYHASKAAATMAAIALAHQHRLEMVISRPFHVFGEGEANARFWPELKEKALEGRDFEMTAGEQIRDFTPVEEVAEQLLALVGIPVESGCPLIKNLGTGRPQSLRKFAEDWWRFWKARGTIHFGAKPYREGEIMRYVPLMS